MKFPFQAAKLFLQGVQMERQKHMYDGKLPLFSALHCYMKL